MRSALGITIRDRPSILRHPPASPMAPARPVLLGQARSHTPDANRCPGSKCGGPGRSVRGDGRRRHAGADGLTNVVPSPVIYEQCAHGRQTDLWNTRRAESRCRVLLVRQAGEKTHNSRRSAWGTDAPLPRRSAPCSRGRNRRPAPKGGAPRIRIASHLAPGVHPGPVMRHDADWTKKLGRSSEVVLLTSRASTMRPLIGPLAGVCDPS